MNRTLTLVPRSSLPQETVVEVDGLLMVLYSPTATHYKVRCATRRERALWRVTAPFMAAWAYVFLRFLAPPSVQRDLLLAARRAALRQAKTQQTATPS